MHANSEIMGNEAGQMLGKLGSWVHGLVKEDDISDTHFHIMLLIILHISFCVPTIFKTNAPNETVKCHSDAEYDGNGPDP